MKNSTSASWGSLTRSTLDKVNQQKKSVLIAKRGKPIAEIIPVESLRQEIPLKETVTFIGDILSPVAVEDWESIQ